MMFNLQDDKSGRFSRSGAVLNVSFGLILQGMSRKSPCSPVDSPTRPLSFRHEGLPADHAAPGECDPELDHFDAARAHPDKPEGIGRLHGPAAARVLLRQARQRVPRALVHRREAGNVRIGGGATCRVVWTTSAECNLRIDTRL